MTDSYNFEFPKQLVTVWGNTGEDVSLRKSKMGWVDKRTTGHDCHTGQADCQFPLKIFGLHTHPHDHIRFTKRGSR